MLKCTYIYILTCITGYTVAAQNLVTNPGFELHNACPSARGQINASPGYDTFYTAIDWVDPTNTSPDYFNTCATDSEVRLPKLALDGYHEARHGDACAGIFMFNGDLSDDTSNYWSEYLETRLAQPLIPMHNYYVSFYVCLTNHSSNYYNIISVDKIGARITQDMIDTSSPGPMFYMTGMESIQTPPGTFITDTVNWTEVSGIYEANGGEQWLTLGHFYENPVNYELVHYATDTLNNHPSTCYMLVDDVCVIDMSYPVQSDTTIYSPQFPIAIGTGKPTGKYLWDNGDTSEQREVNNTGTYFRQRWSECGYYVDTFKISEMPVENCLWLPSAFTPNGDGLNDFFGPGNTYCQPSFESFDFSIFNRWGQKVFESNEPGVKWDGSYDGAAAEMGTYYYILTYDYGGNFTSLNSVPATAPVIIHGDVALIR